MAYDAYSEFTVQLRDGTTVEQVEAACQPYLAYRGDSLNVGRHPTDDGAWFSPASNELYFTVTRSVTWNFRDTIFVPMVRAIGDLVDAPFEVTLANESAAERDEATFRMVAGPVHLIPEFEAQSAAVSVSRDLHRILPPPASTGLSMYDLENATSGASIASTGPAGPRPLVTLDLQGVDLSPSKRKEAAALLVLLARTVCQPGQTLHIEALQAGDPESEPVAGDRPRG